MDKEGSLMVRVRWFWEWQINKDFNVQLLFLPKFAKNQDRRKQQFADGAWCKIPSGLNASFIMAQKNQKIDLQVHAVAKFSNGEVMKTRRRSLLQ